MNDDASAITEPLPVVQKYASACQHDIVSTGMLVLTKALRASVQDDDVAQHVLGLLIDMVSDGTSTPGSSSSAQADCVQACKAIVSESANIPAILDLVRRGSLMTKVSAMTLLSSLVRRDSGLTCTALQKSRTAMSTLLATLDDPRDEVRNEVLALLMLVTDASEELRSIVAFDDGFDRLLGSVVKALQEPPAPDDEEHADEGVDGSDTPRQDGAEGSKRRKVTSLDLQSLVLASDCLTVVRNVLKGNAIAQRLFLEGKHLRSCVCVFDLPQRLNEDINGKAASGSKSTTSQHVRLCLMLAVGIVDTIVSAKQRIASCHSSHAQQQRQCALSSTDAAIYLHGSANDPTGPSISSACDSIAAVPGLLEGMAHVAVGTCPALSPELRATTLVVLTGLAAASEPARQILGELLCSDADVGVLQSFTPAVPLSDALQSPGFSLTSTCVAMASVACESRPAREGATMLLQALYVGSNTARTALLAHAFAPPPVPLPTSLYGVALQRLPLRFTSALSMPDARLGTDVMAQVSPPGLVLLSALIMACDSVSVSSRSRPLTKEWLSSLVSCCHTLSTAIHPNPTHEAAGQDADSSAAELFARLTVARVLPDSRMYSSDTTLLQAVARCFAQRLQAGMQSTTADPQALLADVIILNLGRLLLCCTHKCSAAASVVWAEAGPLMCLLLTGRRASPVAQIMVGALLAHCWLYGIPDLRSTKRKGAASSESGVREAVVSALGGSNFACISLLRTAVGTAQQHAWFLSARDGQTQALVLSMPSTSGPASEEGLVPVDSFLVREIDSTLTALSSFGGESEQDKLTATPAAAGGQGQNASAAIISPQHERVVGLSGAFAVPAHPDFSLSSDGGQLAQPLDSQQQGHAGGGEVPAALVALQAEKAAWEGERVAWSNAVQEREEFIRQQQQQVVDLTAQLEEARSNTGQQSTYSADLMPRAEAEATIEGWRAALAERDEALGRLESERNGALARAEQAEARVAAMQADSMQFGRISTSQANVEVLLSRLSASESRCAEALDALQQVQAQLALLQQQRDEAQSQASQARAELDNFRSRHRQTQSSHIEASARIQILSDRLAGAEAELISARTHSAQAAEAAEATTREMVALVQAGRSLAAELSTLRVEQRQLLAFLAVQEERVSLLQSVLAQSGLGQEAQRIEDFAVYALQQVEGAAKGASALLAQYHSASSASDSKVPSATLHQFSYPTGSYAQEPPLREERQQEYIPAPGTSQVPGQAYTGHVQDYQAKGQQWAGPVSQQGAYMEARQGQSDYAFQGQYEPDSYHQQDSHSFNQGQAFGYSQQPEQHFVQEAPAVVEQPNKLFASAVQLGSLFGGLARSAVQQVATAATGAGLTSAAQDLLLPDEGKGQAAGAYERAAHTEQLTYGGNADGLQTIAAAGETGGIPAPMWAGTSYNAAPALPQSSAASHSHHNEGSSTVPSSEAPAQDAVFRPFAEVLGQSSVGVGAGEGASRARSRTRSRSGNVSTAGSDIPAYVARGSAQGSQGISRPASEVFSAAAFDQAPAAMGEARSGSHTPAAHFFGTAAPQTTDAATGFQNDGWGDVPLDSVPLQHGDGQTGGSIAAPPVSSQQEGGLTDIDLDSSVPLQHPWPAVPAAALDGQYSGGELQAVDLSLGNGPDPLRSEQADYLQQQHTQDEAHPAANGAMWTGASYSGYGDVGSSSLQPHAPLAPVPSNAPPVSSLSSLAAAHPHPARPQYVQYPQYAAAPSQTTTSSVAAAAQFFSSEGEDSHTVGAAGGPGGGSLEHDPSSGVYDPRHGGWHQRGGTDGHSDGGEGTPFPVLSFVGGLMSSVAKTVVKEAKSVAQSAAAEVAKAQPSITNAVAKAGPLPGLLNLAGSMVGLGSAVQAQEQGHGGQDQGIPYTYDASFGGHQQGGAGAGYDAGGAGGATWYGSNSAGQGQYEGQGPSSTPMWSGSSTGSGPAPTTSYPTMSSSQVGLQAPPMYAAAPVQTSAAFGYSSTAGYSSGDGAQGQSLAYQSMHMGGSSVGRYGGQAAGGPPGLQPYGGTLYKGQRRVAGAGAQRPMGQ